MEEKNKWAFPNYVVIDSSVFLDSRLTFADKFLYALISALSNNEKRTCYATNNYFAKAMNLQKRQVQYIISKLIKLNYIKIDISINKRTIQTFTNIHVVEHIKNNKANEHQIEIFDYDWLNEED